MKPLRTKEMWPGGQTTKAVVAKGKTLTDPGADGFVRKFRFT